ncbi:MAG: hypothetical protein ACOYK9_03515 [Chlamydiia bacterium]
MLWIKKTIMKKLFSRLCPFCEGLIDYYTDECPYCGSHMEKAEAADPVPHYTPNFRPKSIETEIATHPEPLSQNRAFLICIGGSLAPFSFFLWLMGSDGRLDLSIDTTWMPLFALVGIGLLAYGFLGVEELD